ncbi:amino acid adenylation domain-containing protein [Pseudoduganella sp. SL102]|uniref:amino acid adenylation domain-containing protein n=1 Tax=Pseudoduganella sp. SL102 TaxID=2995154 RepID=UPI00248C26B8|nr:amino acid adenylation domain-containing protein [Pseudoduganella sp. SL102]WBS00875.1 amino acid adenylation domain-containing protein [Pseudoduganella sp. SL102]
MPSRHTWPGLDNHTRYTHAASLHAGHGDGSMRKGAYHLPLQADEYGRPTVDRPQAGETPMNEPSHTSFNLAAAVYRHALASPGSPAVVSGGRALSYSELAACAARLAACLAGSRTWQRCDGQPPRVGILASRGVDSCVAILGACWAGATYVPIGLKQPAERIAALLRDSALAALVTDDDGAKLLGERVLAAGPALVVHAGQAPPAVRAEGVDVVALAALPPEFEGEPAPMSPADTAYIIYTSGTTGVPKGVMISAGAARHYLAMITAELGLLAGDRALETCEPSFDFSVHNMFSTWEAGAALHILPASTVMNAVKFIRDGKLTVWNSVPSLAGMLRQVKALAPGSLATLRITVFGGEQLPAATVTAWREAAPHSAIVNLYGPTEATVFCLAQRLGAPLPVTPGRDVIAIGTPLPGNVAAIVDEDGQPLRDDVPGELLIAGRQLADGYLGAQELTAARFPLLDGQRWYRTGDLALRDGMGRFHCLGRIDNQVKVLGYRVELEEIEAHLRSVSGADIVAAVAWPLADGMARGIVGFVGAAAVDAAAIIDALRTRLPAYMLPGRVIALAHMPLGSSGKVDRRALRQLLDSAGP